MKTRVALIAGHRYGCRLARAMVKAASAGEIDFTHAFLLHPRNIHRYGGYESAISTLIEAKVPLSMFDDAEELSRPGMIPDPPPQFTLVCGLRQIVPVEVLWRLARENGSASVHSPRSGFVAFHPSDLPDGAGLAPVQWTIFERQTRMSVTAFFIDDERIDGGPIIGKRGFEVGAHHDAGDLDDAIGEAITELFVDMIPSLGARDVPTRPQASEGKRRVRPQIPPQDRWVDFAWDMDRIDLTVRAFAKPYGGTAALIGERPALIYRIGLEPHLMAGARSGVWTVSDHGILVKCRDGVIRILELEYLDGR